MERQKNQNGVFTLVCLHSTLVGRVDSQRDTMLIPRCNMDLMEGRLVDGRRIELWPR